MMRDLANFTTADMFECVATIKKIGEGAKTLEEAAKGVVSFLFQNLFDKQTGKEGCALVRFYKTHPYGELDPELQAFARKILAGTPASPGMKCLTLLATAGTRPEWNDRKFSNGHKAIPLASVQFVKEAPMVAQLIKQFGMEISNVVSPSPDLIMDLAKREFNVFYVPKAQGSGFIPAQDEFVIPHNVQSVVGFGGMLQTGDMVAAIMFCRVPVSRDVAARFKSLGPTITGMAMPFVGRRAVFSS